MLLFLLELFKFPQIVSLARIANSSASFASPLIPSEVVDAIWNGSKSSKCFIINGL